MRPDLRGSLLAKVAALFLAVLLGLAVLFSVGSLAIGYEYGFYREENQSFEDTELFENAAWGIAFETLAGYMQYGDPYSYVLGIEGRDRMAGDFGVSVVMFACADLGVSLVYHLAMLLVGQADSLIDVLFLRTLPTALLSLIVFVPFAYYFARLRTTGAGLGGRDARGGHFSTRGL